MPIRHFLWTQHATERLDERHLPRSDVERAIAAGHGEREINNGRADWLLTAITATGVPFEAIYDHPAHGDATTVRIVSAWRLD